MAFSGLQNGGILTYAGSIVSYSNCCLSVASFVTFLSVSVCDTRCQPTVLCQNGTRLRLDR